MITYFQCTASTSFCIPFKMQVRTANSEEGLATDRRQTESESALVQLAERTPLLAASRTSLRDREVLHFSFSSYFIFFHFLCDLTDSLSFLRSHPHRLALSLSLSVLFLILITIRIPELE